jgi:hypothetical protein
MKQVLALSVLCLTLVGCMDAARMWTKAQGIPVDPFPGPCQMEASLKAGVCVPVSQVAQP